MTINADILVCGLGSMGKRRIKILRAFFPYLEICGIDLRKDRRIDVEKQFNIKTEKDFYKAFSKIKPSAVFVCTPPLVHSEFVVYALENNAHTFSEINLTAEGYETIIDTARKKNKTAFLSSTFLYREEINWIIEKVKNQNNISYRYHVGQFLPNWHPWEKYTDFFASQKESSACKEIMSIEFPWILKAFGKVKKFKVMKNKFSKLELDHEDTFHLLFEHENGVCGNISIDCVCIIGTRKLEIYSDKLYLEWDGTPDSLMVYSQKRKKMISVPLNELIEKDENYDQFVVENPYINEVKEFFYLLERNKISKPKYGYEDDLETINFIQKLYSPEND